MSEKSEIVITCPPRQSWVLANEVKSLGYDQIEENRQGVVLFGTMEDCMRLNLHLRTASRVLFLIKKLTAVHPDILYKELKKLPWEKLIPMDGYFSINSFVNNDFIRDNRFANLRVKDAIVDRIQEKASRRPNSGPDQDRTVLFLHWVRDEVAIFFDTSGETIAKHGYRKFPHKAPLSESLAASLILATNWNSQSIFVNPMCGSGTLAIEAALIASNTPPGLDRKNFGFMHLNDYDPTIWNSLRRKALDQVREDGFPKIIATDISGRALEAAQKNAKIAGVDKMIDFWKGPFQKTIIPEGEGVVILNPEYGERMGEEEELESIYRAIGDFFKNKCAGKMGYIFTGNMNLAKKVGLRAKRRLEFFNAKIDCRLLEYELYQGSKKEKENFINR
ncbi:MAG: class I SAM-dependent RNA methyltransferase [Cyclobacteriaceae bacterium]